MKLIKTLFLIFIISYIFCSHSFLDRKKHKYKKKSNQKAKLKKIKKDDKDESIVTLNNKVQINNLLSKKYKVEGELEYQDDEIHCTLLAFYNYRRARLDVFSDLSRYDEVRIIS